MTEDGISMNGDGEDEVFAVGETVTRVLRDALRWGASHVHLDLEETGLAIRFRIDGLLSLESTLPRALHRAIVGRVKVIAGMDLTERRVPQTGFFALSEHPESRFRVEVAPARGGERVTVAIHTVAPALALDGLGLREPLLSSLRWFAAQDRGLVLAAGPAGSGKMALLTALLVEAQTDTRHLATIEFPVERKLEGISQFEVNPAVGCDQHRLLASVKRQDVDVLLCSRLEDGDAARQAMDLAAEGCLVLAGMHVPDAVCSVTRLMEVGIEPFQVAANLLGAVGQRLVRKLCGTCRLSYEPPESDLRAMGLDREQLRQGRLWRAPGCCECRGTGYRGRTGLYQVLPMSGPLREAISRQALPAEWAHLARLDGFRGLRQEGLAKVVEGETTWQEVLRVTEP